MKQKEWALLLGITAVALLLRLVNLNGRSLWYDEIFTLLYAAQPAADILGGILTQVDGAAAEVHPPLFYTLLNGWITLFGQSHLAARALSVLCGVATVPVAYALARRLFNQQVAIAAAVFVTIYPFHLYYSQEIRMYGFLALAAVTAVYCFVRAWQDGGWGNWLAYSLAAAVTLYTHNLGAVFLAGLGMWLLWYWLFQERWQQWRPVVAAHLLLLLLFVPWLLVLPSQLSKVQQSFWTTPPGLVEIIQTLLVFHFGYDNQALPGWLLPLVFFMALLIPAILLLEARRLRAARGLHQQPVQATPFPAPYALLLFLAVGPVILTLLVSQITPVFTIRSLLPSGLMYGLLVVGVLFNDHTPRPVRWGLVVPAVLVALASLVNHYQYDSFPRSPFAEAAVTLHNQTPDEAIIIHSNKMTYFPTYYYDPTLPQVYIGDEPGSASDTLLPVTQAALGHVAVPTLETAAAAHHTVWFVIFAREIEEYEEALGQPHPHLTWLSEQYQLTAVQEINDLMLFLYE
jgi:mannosyltransferase